MCVLMIVVRVCACLLFRFEKIRNCTHQSTIICQTLQKLYFFYCLQQIHTILITNYTHRQSTSLLSMDRMMLLPHMIAMVLPMDIFIIVMALV